MNVALATTAKEIQEFEVKTGRDSYGTFHILTGYEGTGGCHWCGAALTGRSTRWCRSPHRDQEGHWHEYWKRFNWGSASFWCLQRYDHRCANCGRSTHTDRKYLQPWDLVTEYSLYGGYWNYKGIVTLEVHHIIPLNGAERIWTPFNLPFNLIALCHSCHLEVHAAMRPSKELFAVARATGQGIFEPLLKEAEYA